MAQPTQRQEQAAQTRQRLLAAAAELFAKNGYSATSVRAIHRAAGKSDGILYHYFPGGKEELLRCLLQEGVKLVVHDLDQLAASLSALPLEEALEQLYQYAEAVMGEHGVLLRIILREDAARQVVTSQQVEALFRFEQQWFPDFLRQRAEAGEIRPLDYESAAMTMQALMSDHFSTKLVGLGPGCLSDPAVRKRLVQFHVSLWKK